VEGMREEIPTKNRGQLFLSARFGWRKEKGDLNQALLHTLRREGRLYEAGDLIEDRILRKADE